LLKEHEGVKVDLIDRLPTPFGLVRSGVAPDHPEVKSVQNDFTEIASDPRVSFRGNVEVGKNISLRDLRKHYNAVVLAYGSDEDRRLGLDKEETLKHVHSARAFVNWYNGHPDWVDFEPNLECEDVVIVGQGNVAVDCARILCKTVSELKNTDIAQHALDALAESKVKRVHVIGRRGHVQAAFTTKELREMTKLEDASLVVDPKELELGLTKSSEEELSARSGRAAKRQAKILEGAISNKEMKTKQCHMRFLLSPVSLIESSDDENSIGAVRMSRNRLEGEPGNQSAVSTEEVEDVPCGMLLRSIGYRSVALDDEMPFDTKRHVVPNELGRVTGETGLYVSGWLKRGPSGIIGTNIVDARQTVASIMEDIEILPEVNSQVENLDNLIEGGSVVTWPGYERIDEYEVRAGERVGKPREKMTSVPEMLEVASESH